MAKINTRYDTILPRLPRDESAAEQRQFNESILKAIEALGINANADITKLNEDYVDFIDALPIGQTLNAFTEDEADEFDDDDRLLPLWEDSTDDNYTVSKYDYPDLATARPKWVSGDTIIIPNLNNRVLRHLGDDCETEGIGASQMDAMQRIIGEITFGGTSEAVVRGGTPTGVFSGSHNHESTDGYDNNNTNEIFKDIYFDNAGLSGTQYKTNGNGSGNGETRVKSFIIKSYVRAK